MSNLRSSAFTKFDRAPSLWTKLRVFVRIWFPLVPGLLACYFMIFCLQRCASSGERWTVAETFLVWSGSSIVAGLGLLLLLSVHVIFRNRRQGRIRDLLQQVQANPSSGKSVFSEIDRLYRFDTDLDGRISEWSRLAERYNTSGWPSYHLGIALNEAGSFSEAINVLCKARDVENDDLDIQFALARALLRNGEYLQSVEEFEHVLQMDPENILIPPELIQALLAAGQLDAARQEAVLFKLRGGTLAPELQETLGL